MTSPKILLSIAILLGISSFASATNIVAVDVGGAFAMGGGGTIALTGAQLIVAVPNGFPNGSLSFSLPAPATDISGLETWTANALGSFTFSTTGLTFVGSFDCAALHCTFTPGAGGSGVFRGDFSGLLTSISGTERLLGSFNQSVLGAGGIVGVSSATPVPEIGTLGMVGLGLLGIAGFTKRKFSAAASKFRAA